jgi:clan AA aspartic protease
LGTFSVDIEIGDSTREQWITMNALVDTGASITSMSASTLRELGVEPVTSERFKFAQGEVRTMEIGYTWLRFAGKEILTQVLFNEEGSPPLLGALALEGAYMGVDPVEQRLIPVQGLMMGTEARP